MNAEAVVDSSFTSWFKLETSGVICVPISIAERLFCDGEVERKNCNGGGQKTLLNVAPSSSGGYNRRTNFHKSYSEYQILRSVHTMFITFGVIRAMAGVSSRSLRQ